MKESIRMRGCSSFSKERGERERERERERDDMGEGVRRWKRENKGREHKVGEEMFLIL